MNQACREQAQLIVAYVKAELHPLERTRLESHLENCSRCAALERDLSRSLGVAEKWSPEVDPAHLERLVSRLTPYFDEASSRPRFVFGFGFAAAAVAAVVVAVVALRSPPSEAPSPAAPAIAMADVGRISPEPFLRMVTSADWDGRVETPEPGRVKIAMSRGFAVVDFTGGEGRTLEIDSPGARVEVIGTRFFVEVPAGGGGSVVGVAHGKVRVTNPRKTDLLEAGASRTYLSSGEASAQVRPAAAGEHLEDDYLDPPALAVAPAPPPVEPPSAIAPPPAVRRLFARAEAMARRGKPRAALAIYRLVADSDRAEDAPFKAIARYEMARLYGLALGETARAEQLLRELVEGGSGEVAVEARFTRCELQLASSPCKAAACLNAIAGGGTPAVSTEARHLLVRWRLDSLGCADQKTAAPDQPTE